MYLCEKYACGCEWCGKDEWCDRAFEQAYDDIDCFCLDHLAEWLDFVLKNERLPRTRM